MKQYAKSAHALKATNTNITYTKSNYNYKQQTTSMQSYDCKKQKDDSHA